MLLIEEANPQPQKITNSKRKSTSNIVIDAMAVFQGNYNIGNNNSNNNNINNNNNSNNNNDNNNNNNNNNICIKFCIYDLCTGLKKQVLS